MSNNILFDPHCINPRNVKEVTVELSAFRGKHKSYVFPFGPVYGTTLEVTHNGTLLKLGVDYLYGNRYFRGTHITARSLIGSIWHVNKNLTGSIKIKAHALGGEYTASKTVIDAYYAERYSSPDQDSWEVVLGQDIFFPAVSIKFDIDQWNGETKLINAINAIKEQKEGINPSTNPIYKLLLSKIEMLSKAVADSNWQQHLSDVNNPHHGNHTQIGAVHKLGTAGNALKVYGKDIAALTEYILSQGVTEADLSQYIKLDAVNDIVGDVTFNKGLCYIKRADSLQHVAIDLSLGTAHLSTDGNATVTAEGDVSLIAGTNTLVLSHSAAPDENCMAYNGELVLTQANLQENIPPREIMPVNISHYATSTFRFSGNGSKDDPLQGEAIYPIAGIGAEGAVLLTSSQHIASNDTVPTPKLANLIKTETSKHISETVTINGNALTNDVTINKNDIGLDKISNTSDKNKPITSEALTELQGLADKIHHHPVSDYILDNSTETKHGGARLIVDDTVPQLPGVAIAPSSGITFLNQLYTTEVEVNKAFPNDVLDVKKYFTVNAVDIVYDVAKKSLKMPKARYYNNRMWSDYPAQTLVIADSVPLPWKSIEIYLYVTSASPIRYIVSKEKIKDDAYLTRIGLMVTNASSVVTAKDLRKEVIRFGQFKELDDHINDPNAHGLGGKHYTKADFKLSKLTDASLAVTKEDIAKYDNQYVSVKALYDVIGRKRVWFKAGKIISGVVLDAYDGAKPPCWVATPVSLAGANTKEVGLHSFEVNMVMVENKPKFVLTINNIVTDGIAINYNLFYFK